MKPNFIRKENKMYNTATLETRNGKLKDLSLHSEEHMGIKTYYLTAVYEYETETSKIELTVPHIDFPVKDDCIITSKVPLDSTRSIDCFINMGFNNLRVRPVDGYHYGRKILEEKKPQKMTLSEIEKMLGHKVELVSEK